MADVVHLGILNQGVEAWNKWRKEQPDVRPNLSGAKLSNSDLSHANLSYANLSNANLSNAKLWQVNLYSATLKGAKLTHANLSHANISYANLSYANLSHATLFSAKLSHTILTSADLSYANLVGASLFDTKLINATLLNADLTGAGLGANLLNADLSYANLSRAYLNVANLSNANLTGANLRDATLRRAILIETTVTDAVFTGCSVYGISVWNLQGEPKDESNLYIGSSELEPVITVDDLEVAQFIYVLTKHEKLRNVIDTITSKVVLILGRFNNERKPTLDAMADFFRQNDYVPVIFDFQKPDSQSFLETVATLARLARFVIADFTDAKMVDAEVITIADAGPPILPVLLASSEESDNATLISLRKTHKTILDTYRYKDTESLLTALRENVVGEVNTARDTSIRSDEERSEVITREIREKWDQR